MIGTRSAAHWLGAVAILGAGCMVNLAEGLEDAIADLELDEPFESDLQVEGVERASVRAGLFAKNAAAEVVAADGTTSTDEVSLEIDRAEGGRIDAYLPSGASAASLRPLQAAAIDDDGIVFTLPELAADAELVAVVWYDDDGDGALDLRTEATSEAARTIARDHDGAPHYLAYYSYDATEDSYSATAVADASGTTSNVILSRDQMGGWTVTIDRATE
jgi:hypothetical protein